MQLFRLYRNSYSGLSREVWILGLVTLVNRSGMMVLPFMTLYLTSAKHFSIAEAGIVSAFFGVGSMCGAYLGGYLSDKLGYFRVQLFSLIAGGISCILLGYLEGMITISLGMFITSLLLDMLRPAMSASVSEFATADSLTRSYSLIRMAINLGAGLGPAIAGILAGIDFRLIFFGDGITSIAAGILLYFSFSQKIKNDHRVKKEKIVEKPVALHPYFIPFLFFTLCYAVVFFQLFTSLPIYYEQVHHLSKQSIGLLISLNGLIVFLFEMMLVYKIENTVHPRSIITFGTLLCGIGLIMLNLTTAGIITIVSMVLLSFSEIFAMPFMMTVAVQSAQNHNRGKITGMYSVAWSAAFIIAPLLGTFIITHFGFANLWWFMGGLCLVTMMGFWRVIPLMKGH